MPERTNEFQELVALIQRALAPHGATVSESALVEVSGLSTMSFGKQSGRDSAA